MTRRFFLNAVLFLSLLVLSACVAKVPVAQVPPPAAPVVDVCADSEADRWTELGEFYRGKYTSDLVFGASVETEKLKSSLRLVDNFLRTDVLTEYDAAATSNTIFNKYEKSSDITLSFRPPAYKINDSEAFYNAVITDRFMSYFSLKKKVGTWWTFVDLSNLVTWEAYFWNAYFVERGLEPEFAHDLNMLVLGNFSTAEEALYMKDNFVDSQIPITVAFVVYDKFPAVESSAFESLNLSAGTTDSNEKSSVFTFTPVQQ